MTMIDIDSAAFAAACVLLIGRHLWVERGVTRDPATMAARRQWVSHLLRGPGMEILAVQTLRNSIMASTIMASTSALGLMGLLSLGHLRTLPAPEALATANIRLALPVLMLAVCLVLFSQAVRLYHRCGFLMALTGDAGRELGAGARAVAELEGASRLYRHGWRTFYLAMAAGAWLVSGVLALGVAAALVGADLVARAE